MKILNSIWFTPMGSYSPIGIVYGTDPVTGKDKAYIGNGHGGQEAADTLLIAQTGAKFPPEIAKQLFK